MSLVFKNKNNNLENQSNNVYRFNKYLTIRFPKPNFSYSEDSGDTNIIDDVENVIKKGGKYILDI